MRGGKTALRKLVKWAKSKGFKRVVFDCEGESHITWVKNSLNDGYEIHIEKTLNLEEKVYFLLHELGHHILRSDWEFYENQFPILVKSEQVDSRCRHNIRRLISYGVSIIDEEFKAWDEGELLAIELGIKINKENFDKIKVKSLISYIRHYGR
jgi:hypothetical protein